MRFSIHKESSPDVSSTEKDVKVVPASDIVGHEVEEGELIDVGAGDEAAKYAGMEVELDPALSRRLVRKADLYICSIMCFVYAIQFMDKVSNSSAAIMGLRKDLDMHGKMYSWVGSSFYLGYLLFEIPVSLCLQKFHLGKCTGIFICLWGVVLACSAASQQYAGYISTRVLLGILEGAITPSFLRFTSQWYKREEQFARVCVWFAWNGIGSIIGSAIAYGLYDHSASYSMESWRILLIVLGLMTVVCGVVFFFHVPNSPATAWFLDDMERAAQVERIRGNQQGFGSHKIKWDQVKEAFIDVRTYLNFAIVILNNIPNGGITNFQTILYEGMGFDTKMTLCLSMGGGAVEVVGCTVVGIMSLYIFRGYRMVYAIFAAAMTLVIFCILSWVPHNSGKMAALMLSSWLMPVAYISLLSCISSNSAGSTKKSITGATLLIGYCVGNMIGPQTFKTSEAPGYQTAKTTMAACAAINVVLYCLLTYVNVAENKRRDRKNEKLPPNVVNAEFADLTDFQNPEFRYAL